MSNPIIFTNRAAFDAYVGNYTLLPLNAPQIVTNAPQGFVEVTYDNLMTFKFSYPSGFFGQTDPVLLGATGLAASGTTLKPVTAFGFDVVSVASAPGGPPNAPVFGNVNGLIFSLISGTFIGFVSTTPFTATIGTANGGVFSINQIALKVAPQPSAS